MAKTARTTSKSTKTNMSASVASLVDTSMDIDALLGGLDMPDIEEQPMPEESKAPELKLEAAVSDDDLNTAIELVEHTEQAYAEQGDEALSDTANTPLEADAGLDAVEALEAPAKGKKEKAPKVAKAPKEPKAPSAPRETMLGKKLSEIVSTRTGGNLADYLVFDVNELALSAEALSQLIADRTLSMNGLPLKCQNKFRYTVDYLSGKKATLQEYVKRAFEVLAKDGNIVTGREGNYALAMTVPATGKPFGMGTAMSQVAQMQTWFVWAGICTKERGMLTLNPNSTIFAAVKTKLGL